MFFAIHKILLIIVVIVVTSSKAGAQEITGLKSSTLSMSIGGLAIAIIVLPFVRYFLIKLLTRKIEKTAAHINDNQKSAWLLTKLIRNPKFFEERVNLAPKVFNVKMKQI